MDLKAIRADLKLTQAEMAALLGLHQSTFSRYETGEIELDERMRLALRAIQIDRAA
jgi:transcriptional regulator with XRE-family HTH domain